MNPATKAGHPALTYYHGAKVLAGSNNPPAHGVPRPQHTLISAPLNPTIQNVRVSNEDLDNCCNDLIDVLNATRVEDVDVDRFRWLYERNPDGPAAIWTLREDNGALFGFTACLPRRLSVQGQTITAWNGADFSILPSHRTLGPAVKLRKAAKLAIDAGDVSCLFAHPNDKMAKIHARVGHRPIGTMIRMAKPLRPSSYLASRSRVLQYMARYSLDPVVRFADRAYRHRRRNWEIEYQMAATFSEAHSTLFAANASDRAILGVRDRAYLQWRYADCPLYETRAIQLYEGGKLRGYLLFAPQADTWAIKDIFPAEATIADRLLAATIRLGFREGIKSLSFGLLSTHPLVSLLNAHGFRNRAETSQMFGYVREGLPFAADFLNAQCWHLTVGDRDV